MQKEIKAVERDVQMIDFKFKIYMIVENVSSCQSKGFFGMCTFKYIAWKQSYGRTKLSH